MTDQQVINEAVSAMQFLYSRKILKRTEMSVCISRVMKMAEDKGVILNIMNIEEVKS